MAQAGFPFDQPKINWESKDLASEYEDFQYYVKLLFNPFSAGLFGIFKPFIGENVLISTT